MKNSDSIITASRLTELLTAMRGRRVLVFGDVMVDCFIRGVVERI